MARLTVRLTAEGRRELEEELARLEAELPTVSSRLGDARAGGNDPAENLDLRDAMDALALLEGRIGELRALLAAAEPIEDDASRDGVIRLGAQDQDSPCRWRRSLVHARSRRPRPTRAADASPRSRPSAARWSVAKKNEEVTAETPSGPEHLVVLDVA